MSILLNKHLLKQCKQSGPLSKEKGNAIGKNLSNPIGWVFPINHKMYWISLSKLKGNEIGTTSSNQICWVFPIKP